MAAQDKERKSSFKLTNILNFFEELIHSSKSTSPATKVSNKTEIPGETCNESVNREPEVQKEVLIHWPLKNDESRSKGNDDSKASSKDLQDKDNKDLTKPIEREVECIIETVKTEEERQPERNLIQNRNRRDRSESVERSRSEQHSVQLDSPRRCRFKTEEERQSERNLIQNRNTRGKSVERSRSEQHSVQSDFPRRCGFKTEEERQSERNLIQNRNRQDRSKSVESPRNKQHSVQSDSPKWHKFKTEDGRWFCQVCVWSSSDSTIMSFLDHCSSTNHREKMKGRFDSEQELGRFYSHNLSEVKNKTDESKAYSQFIKWSEVQEQMSIEQQKKPKICNSKKPTTEMMCNTQQTQHRVYQESSQQEGLTSKMKNLLKEGLSVEEPFKTLAVTHALQENKTRNDKRVIEMKPEAGRLKEKLFEVVKQEEKAEIRKGERRKAKKKTDEKTNLDKVETDSKINTSNTKNLHKGGGGEGSSRSENLPIAEMEKLFSALGLTFIKPVSVSFLSCILCEKLIPAGSSWDALVINVGIHIEGKPHLKKLERIVEASNAIVNLMKRIQKSPNGSLSNLCEKNSKTKKGN